MNSNSKTQTPRRALLGALAALTLTLGGLAASVSNAAAGGLAGSIEGTNIAPQSVSIERGRPGEEIPTVQGGLAGGIGGDSRPIVLPQ